MTTPPDTLEIVTVDGVTYRVPTKVLMSKSGYFRALLDTDCMELASGRVDILQESSDYSLIHKLIIYPDEDIADVIKGDDEMQNSILMYNMKYFQLPKPLIDSVVQRIGLLCPTCSSRNMKGSLIDCHAACSKTICSNCAIPCDGCGTSVCVVCSLKCLRCNSICCPFCTERGTSAMSIRGRDVVKTCHKCS
eukprot:TRINITY_DN24800_c0_g1_i1.p1 TRINITY_DN24800_c0_g1~~TRINITY_DN24800_c0_g1_i1.p1  ORF type:complete len:192 (+),score=15.29 TRINITY_DN24800_c0_g1_i1:85-660(+)